MVSLLLAMTCAQQIQFAEIVMTARQADLPASDVVGIMLVGDEKRLTEAAYSLPVMHRSRDKSRAIKNFTESVRDNCK